MLREGLTSEYPTIAGVLGSIRRPVVPREPWFWAGLTAVGATAITSALLQLPLIVMRTAGLRDPAAWASSLFAIAAVAIGAAVGWRAGGGRAVALFVVVHLITPILAVPGAVLFCDRSGEGSCLPRLALGQWRLAAGLVAALIAARLLASGPQGRSAALSATGAYFAAQQLLLVPMGAYTFGLLPAGPADPMTQVAYFSAAFVVAAAVAGAVLGARGASRWAALAPLAVIAVNWALTLWPLLFFEQKPAWFLLELLMGPLQAAALVVAAALVRTRMDRQLVS